MSNIWVGGISFASGFSSGFQRAGLEPLYFGIDPQQTSAIITGSTISAGYLPFGIEVQQAFAETNSNIPVGSVTFDIISQSATAICSTSSYAVASSIEMTIGAVSITANGNIWAESSDLIVDPIAVTINLLTPVNVEHSNIEIAPIQIDIGIGVNVQVGHSIFVINNDFYVEAGYAIPDWKNDCDIDNPYWDKSAACRTNEADLYDCLTTEAYNKVGVPAVWYQVSYSTNNEKMLGEDNNRIILRNFAVQFYAESLPVDDKLWSKWGIEGMDKFHVYITKTHFAAASQYDINGNLVENSQRPKPGDIIKSTHNNVYYDVIEVKDKVEPFLQRSHTWDVTVRPMIDQHYSVSEELATDDIINHINIDDILSHNDIINTEKDRVMYKDSLSNDPFGLF